MSDADAMTDVEVLLATEQIRLLEARYARFADEKRWADLAGLFMPDGTFTSQNVNGENLAAMAGRQEITDNLSGVTAGDVNAIHMLTTSELATGVHRLVNPPPRLNRPVQLPVLQIEHIPS
jgi:hypothetical protein